MKKIIKLFTVNLFWKILSVILAIAFWIVAVGINNPVQYDRLYIPLTISNIDQLTENGYVLLNQETLENTTIEINYSATRSMIDSMNNNKNDIKAIIDLKPIDIGFNSEIGENIPLTVEVDLPSYLTYGGQDFVDVEDFMIIKPKQVNVVLDKYVTRTIPISINVMGEPEDGFIDTTPVSQPYTVDISGAESKLNLISGVEATININDAIEDVIAESTLSILDANRNELSDISISTDLASITVPIRKYKSVPVQARITGQTASGYDIVSITVEPTHIEVFGTAEEIDSFTSLILDPISVDNWSTTNSRTIDVRPYLLDTSLNVRNDTPHDVNVEITLGRVISRQMTITTQNIFASGLSGSVELPGELVFTVNGLSDIINNLNIDDITGRMDLSGLGEGVHLVPIEINLPSGVNIISETPVLEVVIIDTSIMPSEELEEEDEEFEEDNEAELLDETQDIHENTEDLEDNTENSEELIETQEDNTTNEDNQHIIEDIKDIENIENIENDDYEITNEDEEYDNENKTTNEAVSNN